MNFQEEEIPDLSSDFNYPQLQASTVIQLEETLQEYEQHKIIQENKDTLTTIETSPLNSKNVPKIFGNYFRKFCRNQNIELYQGVIHFVNLKTGTQVDQVNHTQKNYGFYDIQGLIQSDEGSRNFFKDYLENDLFIDLIRSDKIENPLLFAIYIEQLIAGCNDPVNFKSMVNKEQ